MSKDDFIKHMRELAYRLNSEKARVLFEQAINLYEENLPSMEDQMRLFKARELAAEAKSIQVSVESRWSPPAPEAPPKSVDEVVEEIAKSNNGIVKSKVGI